MKTISWRTYGEYLYRCTTINGYSTWARIAWDRLDDDKTRPWEGHEAELVTCDRPKGWS